MKIAQEMQDEAVKTSAILPETVNGYSYDHEDGNLIRLQFNRNNKKFLLTFNNIEVSRWHLVTSNT